MATFSYVVIDRTGKESRGSIDAQTLDRAAAELKKAGLTIATLGEAGNLDRDITLTAFEKKPKPRDLAIFCRQFVSIVNAGVSVISALEMLAEQTENKRLGRAIQDCKVSIEKGETFSASLAKHRDIFSDMFITMVEAGEASGSLDVSLTRMAEQEEKDAKLKGAVKKAAIYPTIVGIVAIGVILCMLTFVVPTFQSMFAQIGGKMPALTLAIISMSNFVKNCWYLLLVILAALVLGIRAFRKTEAGQRFNGRIARKLPLVGKLAVKTASARLARTLSTLLAAGIPMIDALQITAGTMTNVYFRDALMDARDDVAMGNPLSSSLRRSGMFPPLVYHMVGIGEESGNIEEMLGRLAAYYEEEVAQATAQLMAALEPLIIVFLALIVGTVIFSIILPMVNMYSALDTV